MIQAVAYIDLRGQPISLDGLDADEHKLIARLKRRATTHPDWNDFENYWTKLVAEFYDGRGVTTKASRKSAVYRIAQDLCSRIGIEAGLVRMPDFRDELKFIIHNEFKSRREFCEKTGISEDMLSHVLAGRKQLSMGTLTEALSRIGRTLRIVPLEVTPSQD
jgi:hypothetical protein